jgi:hypothetical protein
MELNKLKVKVSREMLFGKFSQEQIMEFYFGEPIKLKKSYKNPFRKDQYATCFFFYKQKGELVFMDFSLAKALTCIDIAGMYHSRPLSYQEIYEEMSRVSYLELPKPTIEYNKEEAYTETIIKVEVMPYDKEDLKFWAQFNISLSTLKHFNVRRVSRAWINGQLRYINVDRDRCYRYIDDERIKLYRPFNKKMKFRNNYIKDFEGMKFIPNQGDLLVITKSMKDIMTLHSLGITAICPRSESSIINEELMSLFLSNFKKVCIWYDSDPTGENRSLEIYNLYKDQGLVRIVHDGLLGKDVSDIVKNHGIDKLKEVCKQLEIL